MDSLEGTGKGIIFNEGGVLIVKKGLSTSLNSPFRKGVSRLRRDGVLELPYNANLKEKARALRKAGNLSEVLLWNKMKKKQILGFDFTRQQIIGDYIVDFHCAKLNLVIEIDGESHDYKGEYDKKRDEFLRLLGLEVLHFKDTDVKTSLDSVLMQIYQWITDNPFHKRSVCGAGEVLNTPSAIAATPLIKGNFKK